ncbi:portal protein [Polaribacter phage P12002L]|uniref:Uncharacterized protein n=2 Tax=Incheonvirus TaxID=2976977 RepID=A0A0F7IKJ8_9CAUD|nr:portal protein [Polaribacter phage P12002S]YP_009209674.1 portal protein [Polaribacter phage P12002L]AKG94188.1 hypothetical protein P12002L_0014 [Polaribacter phage P12002L]AKG94270.1 hypothetical protein P12002S_0014 [Polaribacter phage P12002S]
MALRNDEIIKLIESGASKSIKLARQRADKVNMHLTGKGVKQYLEQLDGYETNAQKLLREKLVKSNRSLFSFILRPTDKIFTAKGGSVNYNLPSETQNFIKERISDVADGLDIKKYLKKVVKTQYIIDPNGILFIDIDSNGMLETHVINSKDILHYSNKGNKIKSIIFEPYHKEFTKEQELKFSSLGGKDIKKEKDKKYYRVIDEDQDRIFMNDGGVISEVVSERMNNYFGFVPAIILGDEKDPNTNIFESIVSDLIEDADGFLRRVSVTNIHELSHLYPRYWSYEQACTKCGGEGEVSYKVKEAEGEIPAEYSTQTCSSCGGDGMKTRTNPSDEMVLKAPMEGEPTLAPNVAGYVQPDLMTAKFYNEVIEKARNTMFQAMWGTTYEQGGKRETATGRFLDAQPVQDRLRDISDTFAKLHKFMLDCFGKVLLRNQRYESSVSYGTRYILESPDDILDKYIEASREKISEIATIDIRNRYFEAEYQNDPLGLSNRKKLSNIEPFPSLSVSEVSLLPFLDDMEKLKKLYYSNWVGTLSDAEIVFSTEEKLKENLNSYINKLKPVKTDEGVQVP